jgi:hypothetical protein
VMTDKGGNGMKRGGWWLVALLAVVGCKTAATPEPEAARVAARAEDSEVCPGNGIAARQDLTLKVGCDGLKAGSVNSCAFMGATVIFKSVCDEGPVVVTWTDPMTLFTNDTSGTFTLEKAGDEWKGEVSTVAGPHVLCVNTRSCPSTDTESKTGTLDVFTTGQYPAPK